MSRALTRGQATVETALGAIVFVTVLVFGIHFAEIGILKLRVQQAATSALWDSTGVKHHNLTADVFYNHDNARMNGAAFVPDTVAKNRFKGFIADGANPSVRMALTRGTRLDVTCEPVDLEPRVTASNLGTDALNYRDISFRYPSRGDGLRCNGSAQLKMVGVPTNFLDEQGGFFKPDQVKRPGFFRVCAYGRAKNNRCEGGVALALDDWGLAGHANNANESAECDVNCLNDPTATSPYKRVIKRMYTAYTKEKSYNDVFIDSFVTRLFVTSVARTPVDEREFRFLFLGEDHPNRFQAKTMEGFVDPVTRTTRVLDNVYWDTTPYSKNYKNAYQRRDDCFLGSRCTQSVFKK